MTFKFTPKQFLLGVLLLASVAFAVVESRVDLINSNLPQWFPSGVYVGSRLINPPGNTLNKMTTFLSTTGAYDFPPQAASTCQDSAPFTVTGAKAGDPCFFGVDFAGLNKGATNAGDAGVTGFDCFVTAANTAIIRACNGGSVPQDPNDAGWTVTVISSQ